MKRCPTCQSTFEDNMKFCQKDGTPLVDDAPIGGEDDPSKTVLAKPQTESQPVNQPEESDFDAMKTMLASPPPLDTPPPSPFGDAPKSEPKNTGGNAPSFGDLGSPQFSSSPLPSESKPQNDPFSGGFGSSGSSGGFGQTPSSGQFGQQPSSGGFGQQQKSSGGFGSTPTFKEPEPPPFGNQPNFGTNQPFGTQPTEWTAPPAPQGWGNQGLGQNTPFNPPPKAQSNNQTPTILGIASVALGLISFPAMCICYLNFITAPIGTVLGVIAMTMAKNNPLAKNAKTLGLAGIALNVLSVVTVIVLIAIGVGLRLGQ